MKTPTPSQPLPGYALIPLAALLFVQIVPPASADQFFQESFESAPGGSYTLTDPFDDLAHDYFNRYPVPDPGHVFRDDFVNGWHGSFGIMGDDHGDGGGAATRTITIPGINISGRSGLSVKVSLGALTIGAYEAAEGDGIKIYTTIDGGARRLVGEFAPPAGDGDLMRDTDGDGVGDGALLTETLTSHTFTVPGAGSSMKVEIDLTSTTGSLEVLAVDNVRVTSGSETWTPYYDLAVDYYTYFAGAGDYFSAVAYYYLYYGSGDYYYYTALGRPGEAIYYYYYYLGLYTYYIYAGIGDYDTAIANYYYYFGVGYYNYYTLTGDLSLAYYYYSLYLALASAS